MLATTSTNAANIHMFKSPGYDPEKDFPVVGVIGSSGAFLVVPADSPYKTLNDLLAYAKANPGKLNFGYFNASSAGPGRGAWASAPASNGRPSPTRRSAMPGPTSMPAPSSSCSSTSRQDAARSSPTRRGRWHSPCPQRSPLYPDLPTLAETFPDFTSTGFLAVAVPKATPLPVQQKLNALINEAITSPDIQNRLVNEFALTARPLTLEQCAAQDREERAKWADYVKIAKIEPQ